MADTNAIAKDIRPGKSPVKPQEGNEMEWNSIKTAPYNRTIMVRNSTMVEPIRATRGYDIDGTRHPDDTFCTSVATEYGPTWIRAGLLVCAEEWAEAPDAP